MLLDKKVVIVTGASGGIGREIVTQLAKGGALIALAGRNAEKLSQLQSQLEGFGSKTVIITGDLTQAADRQKLIQETEAALGAVDLLINNAGGQEMALFQDMSASSIDQLFQTNLIAPIQLARLVIPKMIDRGHGRIVNVGSAFGSLGFAGYSTYSASKFGLRGFSEALRRELVGSGVGITYVAPRGTKTALNSDALYNVSKKLGFNFDEPGAVARQIVNAIEAEKNELFIGFPEKFFARLNGLFPALVDSGTEKQSKLIKEFLTKR
jgi:short-subunit dehydrogenase